MYEAYRRILLVQVQANPEETIADLKAKVAQERRHMVSVVEIIENMWVWHYIYII